MSDVCPGAGGLEGQACWPEYGPALVYAGKAEQDAEHGGVTKAGASATRNDDCCVFASVVLLVIAIAHSKPSAHSGNSKRWVLRKPKLVDFWV